MSNEDFVQKLVEDSAAHIREMEWVREKSRILYVVVAVFLVVSVGNVVALAAGWTDTGLPTAVAGFASGCVGAAVTLLIHLRMWRSSPSYKDILRRAEELQIEYEAKHGEG